MILPTSLVDFSFVLYPALRLMNGFKVPEIYFQYDLFLSYLALLWLKLNYSLESFAYLRASVFFPVFCSIFFLRRQVFQDKRPCHRICFVASYFTLLCHMGSYSRGIPGISHPTRFMDHPDDYRILERAKALVGGSLNRVISIVPP